MVLVNVIWNFRAIPVPGPTGRGCGKQPDILVGYALEIAGGTTVDLGPLQGLQLYARPWACPDTNPLAATHIVLNGHAVKTLEGSA
ncbi:MAG: hypothetical protein OXD44_09445 [Gammaproteobacteria bacterium]|nr:hypothetical protein [Gammaproteobacteria bacterium]